VNNGLGSLNILSLASDGVNVLAGTLDAGIFITDNLGANWTAINNGLNSPRITAIECFDGHFFVGTKTEGVYRSDDQGGNWYQSSNGLPEHTYIRCMHVFEDRIFAGTGEGSVFSSNDHGDSWIAISYGLVGSPVLSLHTYGDYLYAGLNAGGVWQYPLSEQIGACCFSDGSCQEMTDDECLACGGQWLGADTACLGDNNSNGIDDACEEPQQVPALSEWGMIVLALLIPAGEAIAVIRKRRITTGVDPLK
jgi:hypothetical protein